MKWLLSSEQYQTLVEGATLLEADGFGPKVYKLAGARILKLFRIKRLLSKSLLYPYTLRFRRNSLRLHRLGIPTVTVSQVFYCPSITRHGLIYPMLPGDTVLDSMRANDTSEDDLDKLAAFIACLHQKGVFFRSLHLGNILQQENGELALIDIADLTFQWWSLTINQRIRNFRHLFRNLEHLLLLQKVGMDPFLERYIKETGLTSSQSIKLSEGLKNLISRMSE